MTILITIAVSVLLALGVFVAFLLYTLGEDMDEDKYL